MHTNEHARDAEVAARGQQWAIAARAGTDSYEVAYAPTEQAARTVAAYMTKLGRHDIDIYTPQDPAELIAVTAQGTVLAGARDTVRQEMARLREAVLAALDAGHSETLVAAKAGVDRKTVRAMRATAAAADGEAPATSP